MEPVKKVRKAGLEHFLRALRDLPSLSPRAVFARLEELGYRGQEGPRRAVSLAAYRHIRRIQRIYLDGVAREDLLPKSNLLLVGPTGCGKTHLVELLFKQILRLPTVIVDITTFSETGYVGHDPSTILTRLLQAADDNPLLASIGIVCLDEFDKIASGQNNAVFAGAGTTKDVTGFGVQRELLKMLEAAEVVVPLELSHSTYSDTVMLSTADIAFIAAGAFSGFGEMARRHAADEEIGFGRQTGAPPRPKGHGFSEADVGQMRSFSSYGFLPELMARFTRVVPFEALGSETLRAILQDSVLARLQREFADEGFELVVAPEVVDHVVAESLRRETGARGLAAVLARRLEETAFNLFAEVEGGRVLLTMRAGEIQVELG